MFCTSFPITNDPSIKKKKDVHIGRDDLRFKLMQKNASRRAQSDGDQKRVDLREKLSKAPRPPVTNLDSRHSLLEPKDTGFLGQIPSTRSVDDLPVMNSIRGSYSTWTLDHLRRRSPDRARGIGTSRGLSPPRNMQELQRRPLNRTHDDVRSVPYVRKHVFDTPGPMSTATFVAKHAPPAPAKPLPPPLGQLPPPTGIVQKIPYAVLLLILAASGSWNVRCLIISNFHACSECCYLWVIM